MNHRDRTPSGSKRKLDAGDHTRPPLPSSHFPRYLQCPEAPKSSSIHHHVACEDHFSRPTDPPPLPPIQTSVSFKAILTQFSAPLDTLRLGQAPSFPSPERSAVYKLPPLTLSPPKSASFTSHSDNSQPEPWTDESTLQGLQRENADLVAANSQAQARIAELDVALQASSAEIAKLFKDRDRLRAKVDLLEAELGETQNSTERSQRNIATKDAQYSQILDFSNRLQTQAIVDAKKCKADGEEWEREKHDMLQTIANLRLEVRTLRRSYGNGSRTPSHDKQEGPTGANTTRNGLTRNDLEAEVHILKEANSLIEGTLSKVREEYTHLSEYIDKLQGIGRNVQRYLQAPRLEQDMSCVPDGERRHV